MYLNRIASVNDQKSFILHDHQRSALTMHESVRRSKIKNKETFKSQASKLLNVSKNLLLKSLDARHIKRLIKSKRPIYLKDKLPTSGGNNK